jgi:integrase
LRGATDPLGGKQAAARSLSLTFDMAAERFLEAHAPTFKNPKHCAQWSATLATHASPVIGSLPVSAVDTHRVMVVLEPIWRKTPETANRLRGRIERILDWAGAQGFRSGENPARWRGHLDKLLPARSKIKAKAHHPALAYAALPAFMAKLGERDGISARALEFTILTAARTGEVIGAKWDEIDLKAKVWTVPTSRMKSGRVHRVPLSDRAVAVLQAMPRHRESFVFPGKAAGAPLSNMAMLELLRGLQPGLTVHGFRSTFRDWAGDRTVYPRDVIELALAHVVNDKTEAAYRRGDALEKRTCLMSDWSSFASGPHAAGDVVPLRRA